MKQKTVNVESSKLNSWVMQWTKFSFSNYVNDFKFSVLYWLLTFLAIIILFQVPIKKLINFVLVEPIISYCPQNHEADLVFLLFFGLSFIFFIRQLLKHIVPTVNSILFGITISIVFFTFFKTDSTYIFYNFSYGILKHYSYSSSFIISILLILFSYKSYMEALSKALSRYSLLDDYPSTEKYDDLYGRSGYAGSVAKHIISTSSNVSFAIGIIGDWGSGKSDFLLRLKSALKDNTENIIFDFNPWRVNKPDAIIEEFFKTLSKKLQPYNQSITKTINDYSSRVLKPAKETHFRFIDALIGSWFQEDDIQKRYDTINESIKATSKRVIVFIDDVDRLTGKEVMEVMRIIRNTANFANTFFVVGIDQNYIVSVLKNTNDFANEEEYLKKVFQLTITLPAFKKDAFVNEIKKHLFTPDIETAYREAISNALTRFGIDSEEDGTNWFFPSFNHESLLEKMIDNIRDLKRFCNSFKITFNILKGEADIHDLIMLELIRNKNIGVYNSIRSRKMLTTDGDSVGKFKIDEDEWAKVKKQVPEKDWLGLKDSFDFLFTDVNYKNQRKLVLTHNFYIYFSYQLFNLISFHEFNQTLEKETDVIVNIFAQWIDEGKEKELSKVISYMDDFKDGQSLKKFVIVLLKLWHPHSNWLEQAKQLVVIGWIYNQKKYFDSNVSLHKEFLVSILNDKTIDPFVRANLANPFLKGIIEDPTVEAKLFITKKELRNIIFHLFNEYLESNPIDPQKTQEFYHLNDYKVEHDVVIYFPPASRRFKKYLLANELGFIGYVNLLFRPSQVPYNGGLVLEPWIEQIFPNWEMFKEKLLNTNFQNNDMNRLKEIILRHISTFFSSGRKPIKIVDKNDSKFVDQYLSLKRLNQ